MDKRKAALKSADEAEAYEAEVKAEGEPEGSYRHEFKTPFQWMGKSYDTLTFDWETLTGRDHLNIEAECVREGTTVVIPEYTGKYLRGMAARACTERDESGRRVLGIDAFDAMRLTDFKKITSSARRFLIRTES